MRASAPAKDLSDDDDDAVADDDDDDAVASAVLARATTARAHRRAADMACELVERVRARKRAGVCGARRGARRCAGAQVKTPGCMGGHVNACGGASLTDVYTRSFRCVSIVYGLGDALVYIYATRAVGAHWA